MTDFETRLTEALTSGAEQAPEPDRLVARARTRAKSRRRTRYAVVAGAVLVAVAVPVGVLALNGDDSGPPDGPAVATDGPDDQPGWHTVEHEGALVDVPGNWERLDTSSCEFEFVRFGPSGSDPCTYDHDGLAFYGSATFDPATGPGVHEDAEVGWSGYVYAGSFALYAQTSDRDLAFRILGTARVEGQDVPDLGAGWRTETEGKLSVDVPASWKDGGLSAWCVDETVPGWIERPDTVVEMILCDPGSGYGIRFGKGSSDDTSGIRERGRPEFPEGSWAGVAITPDETGKPVGFIQIVAPTQALADLIAGSIAVD